ncbi:NAD(+) diphosphatase [Mariniluteicoccus endophyticus]
MNDQWATASQLDRAEMHRGSVEWVAGLWKREDALLVKVDDDGRLFCDPEERRLRMTRPFVEFDAQRHVLLGLVDEAPVFAVRAIADGPTASLRQLNAHLEGPWLDVATTAVAMLHWHSLDPRCAGCGGETSVGTGGTTRHCASCERTHFPRTDAAIIVAILNDRDEILLGHQAGWGEGRVSLLAGFVEAGESLEEAVHREMAEEADVALESVSYFGSQPWPFPRSLMVGFVARASSREFSVDGEEIEYAQWFSRADLDARLADGTVSLPLEGTIAHRIISAWRERRLEH